MKKCPVCDNYYEDIYTRCRDGGRLAPTSDPVPPQAAGAAPIRPVPVPRSTPPPIPSSGAKKTPEAKGALRPPPLPDAPPSPDPSSTTSLIWVVVIIVAQVAVGGGLGYLYVKKNQSFKKPPEAAVRPIKPAVAPNAAVGVSNVEPVLTPVVANANDVFALLLTECRGAGTGASNSSAQVKTFSEILTRFDEKAATLWTNIPAAGRLQKEGLDMTGVTNLEQVRAKKALVTKAGAMLEETADFDQNCERSLRRELQTAAIPVPLIQKVITPAAESKFDALRKSSMAAREADRSYRVAANLLESGWGKWTNDVGQHKIVFKDQRLGTDYTNALKACETAEKRIESAESEGLAPGRPGVPGLQHPTVPGPQRPTVPGPQRPAGPP